MTMFLVSGCAPGERRGGRARGTPNRATADIKALAQPYGAPAVAELARLAGLTDAPGAQHEATRVAALRELLDRGFGKATQHIAGDSDTAPVVISFEWAPALPPAVAAEDGSGNSAHTDALTLEWETTC
jgi:hypothetical protein